jgi:muramidase (phage lysozyme)
VKWLIAAAATVAAAAYLARRATSTSAPAFTLPDGWQLPEWGGFAPSEPDQSNNLFESLAVTLNPTSYTPARVTAAAAATNTKAFLDVIAYAEGADYNTLFGGGTFASFADHPRQFLTFRLGGRDLTSSAAGRYQFLARTWDGLKPKLARQGFTDFGPAAQDAGAIELIRERGALLDVQAGRFATAIEKVRKVWASLPGAGYDQPEKSYSQLLAVYQQAGGITESQA